MFQLNVWKYVIMYNMDMVSKDADSLICHGADSELY
jgi:hypothetical protein